MSDDAAERAWKVEVARNKGLSMDSDSERDFFRAGYAAAEAGMHTAFDQRDEFIEKFHAAEAKIAALREAIREHQRYGCDWPALAALLEEGK